MKTGQIIRFKIETWVGNRFFYKETEAKVKRISLDPMKRREPRCVVEYLGDDYCISFSDILKVSPGDGEQLELFRS